MRINRDKNPTARPLLHRVVLVALRAQKRRDWNVMIHDGASVDSESGLTARNTVEGKAHDDVPINC